jgi:hypothetical protein
MKRAEIFKDTAVDFSFARWAAAAILLGLLPGLVSILSLDFATLVVHHAA